MNTDKIYKDISERTDGAIYMGVVGPVRTGKSTFIKKFMELGIIPNMKDEHQKQRALDELPQSSGGKTIMTTEPKFIPNEATEMFIDENASVKVRLIDCVGFIVEGAMGHIENGSPRMVNTPWNDSPIAFSRAAEIGTKKVITEHSTIGIVVTSDGTITDIDRDDYIEPEERVIKELKDLNKPFIVVLNSINPYSERAKTVKNNIEEKHGISVVSVNCKELNNEDIKEIIKTVLFEFPLSEIVINIPAWVNGLDEQHWFKETFRINILESFKGLTKIKEINSAANKLNDCEHISMTDVKQVSLGDGRAEIEIKLKENLFYEIIEETSGFSLKSEEDIIPLMIKLSKMKKYDKVSVAIEEVSAKGYGIVCPTIEELVLEEPEIVKQGNKFGVKLKASAPSIHMIRADIQTEVSPIVGTEKQSEELVNYLLKDFEVDPKKIWKSNIFGKTLHELINEGVINKLNKMPEDAQFKLQETLQKIINEGSGGLICIIL